MVDKGVLKNYIAARCEENAKWAFDSSDLHCYKGSYVIFFIEG